MTGWRLRPGLSLVWVTVMGQGACCFKVRPWFGMTAIVMHQGCHLHDVKGNSRLTFCVSSMLVASQMTEQHVASA